MCFKLTLFAIISSNRFANYIFYLWLIIYLCLFLFFNRAWVISCSFKHELSLFDENNFPIFAARIFPNAWHVIDHTDHFINSASRVFVDFKMPIDLYQVAGSAPCRAVCLTAAALGVDINLKNVDLMSGEHLKPEFLKVICKGIF